ncbi:MAG: hypothetical protein Q9199_004475 [Rusavskia elegans]
MEYFRVVKRLVVLALAAFILLGLLGVVFELLDPNLSATAPPEETSRIHGPQIEKLANYDSLQHNSLKSTHPLQGPGPKLQHSDNEATEVYNRQFEARQDRIDILYNIFNARLEEHGRAFGILVSLLKDMEWTKSFVQEVHVRFSKLLDNVLSEEYVVRELIAEYDAQLVLVHLMRPKIPTSSNSNLDEIAKLLSERREGMMDLAESLVNSKWFLAKVSCTCKDK